jgi:hypothetical protein
VSQLLQLPNWNEREQMIGKHSGLSAKEPRTTLTDSNARYATSVLSLTVAHHLE